MNNDNDNNPNPAPSPTPSSPAPEPTSPAPSPSAPVPPTIPPSPLDTQPGTPVEPKPQMSGPEAPQPAKKSKKPLIITLITVLVLAIGAAVAYFLYFQPSSTPTADNADPETVVPDLSANFGACDMLDKEAITLTLEEPASELKGPLNAGIIQAGDGDQAQVCVYPFGEEGDASTVFNIDNAFSVEVYKFASEDTKKASTDAIEEESKIESDLSDLVVFNSTSSTDNNTSESSLSVYKGLNLYTLKIAQTKAPSDFDSESAKTKLISLFATATLPTED